MLSNFCQLMISLKYIHFTFRLSQHCLASFSPATKSPFHLFITVTRAMVYIKPTISEAYFPEDINIVATYVTSKEICSKCSQQQRSQVITSQPKVKREIVCALLTIYTFVNHSWIAVF